MFVLCFILAVFGETITVIDPTNERAYTQDVGIFDGSSLGQVRHDPFSSISGSWAGTHSGVTVDAVDRYFRGPDFFLPGSLPESIISRVSGSWVGANLGLVAELVAYHPKSNMGYAFTVTQDFEADISKLNISNEYVWFFRFYLPSSHVQIIFPVDVPSCTMKISWLHR